MLRFRCGFVFVGEIMGCCCSIFIEEYNFPMLDYVYEQKSTMLHACNIVDR